MISGFVTRLTSKVSKVSSRIIINCIQHSYDKYKICSIVVNMEISSSVAKLSYAFNNNRDRRNIVIKCYTDLSKYIHNPQQLLACIAYSDSAIINITKAFHFDRSIWIEVKKRKKKNVHL